jgi:MFS transporter, DHA1 family, multidrug resistance protein
MTELIRDTVSGRFLRLTLKGQILPYKEDRDPSLWRLYIDAEKSGRMAHHGHIVEEEKLEEQDLNGGLHRIEEGGSSGSSSAFVASHEVPRNEESGVKVDPGKGKDVTVVTWFSEDDPEVNTISPELGND